MTENNNLIPFHVIKLTISLIQTDNDINNNKINMQNTCSLVTSKGRVLTAPTP